MKSLIRWEKKLEKQQIEDAISYLSLLLEKNTVDKIEDALKEAAKKITIHKSADLIRASRVHITPGFQKEVAAQLQCIMRREKIKPVILITTGSTLYISDGYHRICACYSIDDAIEIACVHIEV